MRGSEAVSRTGGWITFRLAHIALFIYLQLIVLQAPGNVTTTCKLSETRRA